MSKRERPAGIAAAIRQVLDQSTYTQAARRFAATLTAEAAEHPDVTREAEALLTLNRPQRHPASNRRVGVGVRP